MTGPSQPRSASWAPVGAAVAVVAVVAVVAALLGGRGGDDSADPPLLRLGASGGAAGAAAESSASSRDGSFVASSAMSAAYRLDGALPTDGPERGAVHRPTSGAADEDVVRRLAAALGVTGDPRRDGARWTVQSGDRTLDVSDEPGRPWWYGQVLDLPLPVEPVPGTETGGGAAGCEPVDPSGLLQCGTAATPPDPPQADPVGDDAALAVARPVLEALDLAGADVRTEAYGDTRAVTAAPRVAGLPTQGWETRLEVGPDGGLRWAAGMLADLAAGEEYPLLGAQEAFGLLLDQPRPDIAALCAPDVPCGPTEQVVTGAVAGLQAQYDGQGPLLVPAWLFAVRDAPQPVGQVAVEPAFLAPPELPDAPVPPDTPVEPPAPVDPGDPVEPGRATFAFDRAARGAQESEVVVGYGDSSSCPHSAVVPLVEETEEVVTVTLEADAQAPDRACTADYVGVDLVVPLKAPLGARALVDGTSGTRHELP